MWQKFCLAKLVFSHFKTIKIKKLNSPKGVNIAKKIFLHYKGD